MEYRNSMESTITVGNIDIKHKTSGGGKVKGPKGCKESSERSTAAVVGNNGGGTVEFSFFSPYISISTRSIGRS